MSKIYEIWEDEMIPVGWIVRIFRTDWFLIYERGKLELKKGPPVGAKGKEVER